ncbi:MAG: hypothetical protein WC459_01005 [Patescibacteria group bacterium]
MAQIVKKVRAFFRQRASFGYILIGLMSAGLFSFLQASSVFADPDAFYHAKITDLMLKYGVVKNFSWLIFTVLPQIYTDHHFLYHIFLLPFVKFFNPLIGIKIATVFINTGFILIFYHFLKSQKAKWPGFFTFILLGSAPFLFRISLAKANGLSLIFIMMILLALFRKKNFWLGIISFFYVWAYGGWPLSIALAGLYFFCSGLAGFVQGGWKKNLAWKPLLATATGSAAGLIINPYFPQNINFYWVQTIQIAVINYGSKIGVGAEWYPFDFFNLLSYGWPVILFFLLAILFFAGTLMIKKYQNTGEDAIARTFFFTSLSGIFFVLTLKSCRNTEYFFPFAVLACSFLLKYFYSDDAHIFLKNNFLKILKSERNYKMVIAYVIIMVTVSFAGGIWQIKNDLLKGFSFDKYQEAMLIAAQNSNDSDIIFHSDWDDWPMLFYHNVKNNYIVGLDATFMYKYSKDLFKKWRDITWGDFEGDEYPIIKNDFSASIIFIADKDIDKMDKYFINDSRYNLLYSKEGKVYKLN